MAALLKSASKGEEDEVRLLLEDGVRLGGADYDQRTALHLAASEGHASVVSLLLKAGAPLNAEDRWGHRPMDDAQRKHHSQCVALLTAAGAVPGAGGAGEGGATSFPKSAPRRSMEVDMALACDPSEVASPNERTQPRDTDCPSERRIPNRRSCHASQCLSMRGVATPLNQWLGLRAPSMPSRR